MNKQNILQKHSFNEATSKNSSLCIKIYSKHCFYIYQFLILYVQYYTHTFYKFYVDGIYVDVMHLHSEMCFSGLFSRLQQMCYSTT